MTLLQCSLDLVDNMHLSDFLIPDDINAQQINKKTGSRYNYTEKLRVGVFLKDNFMDFDFKTITQDIDNKLKLTWRGSLN